jgi:hypothetical protein
MGDDVHSIVCSLACRAIDGYCEPSNQQSQLATWHRAGHTISRTRRTESR